jgi:acyl carrier protein
MEKSYLENKIKEIVAETLTVSFDKVTLSAELVGDLGGDSLDMVSLLIALEAEFDIATLNGEGRSIVTVLNVIDAVKKYVDK